MFNEGNEIQEAMRNIESQVRNAGVWGTKTKNPNQKKRFKKKYRSYFWNAEGYPSKGIKVNLEKINFFQAKYK